MDATLKVRFEAETRALRAYYYFNLVRMFKNVPLILNTLGSDDYYNISQATSEDVYEQIETDLTFAIANLPSSIGTEYARLNKGADSSHLRESLFI